MFSVTVPAVLPVTVDELGGVHTASVQIRNNSTGAVKISAITLEARNGWTIVPFATDMAHEQVGSREIGFSVLGAETAVRGARETLACSGLPEIPEGGSLPLAYDAVVSALPRPVTDTPVLSVLFVLEWAEGGAWK